MIHPTINSIGRKVVFRHRSGRTESGIIASIGSGSVWVKYGDARTSTRTDNADLDWAVPAVRGTERSGATP